MKRLFLMLGRELDVLARQRLLLLLGIMVPGLALWLASYSLQSFLGAWSGYNYDMSFRNLPGDFYEYLLLVSFSGVLLFVPAICVGAIADERESETLGLLLMTRLSPFRIIVGKVLARLFVLLVIGAAIFPGILLFARFQGELPEFSRAEMCSLGLSVPASVAICICMAALLPSRLGGYLAGLGSSLVVMVAIGQASSQAEDLTTSIVIACACLLVIVLLGLIVAGIALSWPSQKPKTMRLEVVLLLSRFAGLGRWLKHRGRLKGSPLRWQTKRYVIYSRLSVLLLWVLTVLLVSGLVIDSGESERVLVWLIMSAIALVVLAAYTSSQLLASERRNNTLPLLIGIPDGLRRLVITRLSSSMLLLVVTATVAALPLLYMALVDDALIPVIGYAIYVLAMLFPVYLTGLVFGLLMRKPLPAMTFSGAAATAWLILCTAAFNFLLNLADADYWHYGSTSSEGALAIVGLLFALLVLGALCLAAAVWLIRHVDRVIRL